MLVCAYCGNERAGWQLGCCGEARWIEDDNERPKMSAAPDGIDLSAQVAHQREIYEGDCMTFGEQSNWAIKSGSILASLIELQDARVAHAAAAKEGK